MKKIFLLSLFMFLGFFFNSFSSYGLTFQEKKHIAELLLKAKCKIIKNNNFLQEKIDILQENEDDLKLLFIDDIFKSSNKTFIRNSFCP